MSGKHAWDFVPEFSEALKAQLQSDEERWGDTWLHRPRDGQEDRTWFGMMNRYDKYKHTGLPINWLQVAGDALICWIRECHPEVSPEWSRGQVGQKLRLIISDGETLTPEAMSRVVEENGQRILETEV